MLIFIILIFKKFIFFFKSKIRKNFLFHGVFMAKYTTLLIAMAATLFLVGCSSHYESAPLESIKTKPKVPQKVFVLYKTLTKDESKAYLGRNWSKKGYLPIQVVIENHGEDPVRFYRKGISMPTEDLETIKNKAHASTKFKTVLVGAPSVACVSLGIIGLALAPATFGISGILAPMAIGGTGIQKASTWVKEDMHLDQDYDEKFLKDTEIQPGDVAEGIIFVPKDQFIEKFKVKILDAKNKKLLIIQSKRYKKT